MSTIILDPSGREVSLVKNALLVLKDKVDAPEKIPIEVAGSQEGQMVLSEEMAKLIDSALNDALEFTRQAKMRLPPADVVHSEKAFQNAKTVIGLFLREFPDKIKRFGFRAVPVFAVSVGLWVAFMLSVMFSQPYWITMIYVTIGEVIASLGFGGLLYAALVRRLGWFQPHGVLDNNVAA